MKYLLLTFLFLAQMASAQIVLSGSAALSGASGFNTLVAPVGNGNVWTFVGSTNWDGTATPTYSRTAGNVLICFAKWEGAGGTGTNFSAGNDTNFNMRAQSDHGNGDLHSIMGWKVIQYSEASTINIQISGGTPSFVRIIATEWSVSGTVSFDQYVATTGTSASVATGNITTSRNNTLCLVGYGEYTSGVPSVYQINGVAGTIIPGDTAHGSTQIWYRKPTTTFIGQGTATISSSAWIGQLGSWYAE